MSDEAKILPIDKDEKPDDGGVIGRALTRIFGRSYRTSIIGALSVTAGGIVAVGTAVPDVLPLRLVAIAAALAPILGGAGLMIAKDSRVSGKP